MYRRPKFILSHEAVFPISFHDTDAMGVVWHGNYIKFFELAREAFLEEIKYGYQNMEEEGIAYPITECTCKYRKYLRVTDKVLRVVTLLCEYEGKVVFHYEVYPKDSSTLCAYGKTEQVCIKATTGELIFETPKSLLNAIKKYESEQR